MDLLVAGKWNILIFPTDYGSYIIHIIYIYIWYILLYRIRSLFILYFTMFPVANYYFLLLFLIIFNENWWFTETSVEFRFIRVRRDRGCVIKALKLLDQFHLIWNYITPSFAILLLSHFLLFIFFYYVISFFTFITSFLLFFPLSSIMLPLLISNVHLSLRFNIFL